MGNVPNLENQQVCMEVQHLGKGVPMSMSTSSLQNRLRCGYIQRMEATFLEERLET